MIVAARAVLSIRAAVNCRSCTAGLVLPVLSCVAMNIMTNQSSERNGWYRLLMFRASSSLVILAALLFHDLQLFAQSPCPSEYSQDSDASVESAIKGTLRYHEWSIGVLEEVTTSVSSRFARPEGSDDNSLTVNFDVVTGGAIDALTVSESSGDPSFDDEFLQAILFLAPFSIDSEYMSECSIAGLALSIKWANGGSFTEIRDAGQ